MDLKKVIVILYGKDRHEIIAAGIKEQLSSNKEYDIVTIDDEAYKPGISTALRRKSFIFMQRNANWLYGIYSGFETRKAVRFFNKQKKKKDAEEYTGAKAEKLKQKISYIKNIILRFSPKALVCLTPDALKLSLAVRDVYNFDTKVVAFMADFGADLRFLDIRCDKYFIGNGEVSRKLIKYGIPEDKVMVTGVPYAVNIKENLDKIKCREELNIKSDLPLVVLSGGKFGSLNIIDDFKQLLDNECGFNIIALTGGNKKVNAMMKALKPSDSEKQVEIIEKHDMKKLLTAADIFITVPTTENVLNAVICGCSVIIINPLSEVEKANYSYLKDNKMVKAVKRAHQTSLAVTELLLEGKERQKILNNAAEYIKSIKNTDTNNILMLMEGNND